MNELPDDRSPGVGQAIWLDPGAFNGLDLGIAQGAGLGVLGPNGAGKTTAVRVLTTLLCPMPARPRNRPRRPGRRRCGASRRSV